MTPTSPQPSGTPEPAAVQRLLAAAGALLDARADRMVTHVEWRELRDAVVGCGHPLAAEVAEVFDEENFHG